MRGSRIMSVTTCMALLGLTMSARGDSPSTAGSTNGSANADSGSNADDTAPAWRFTTPYNGPDAAVWHRGQLTDRERAYVDHAGVDVAAESVNTAFASVAAERANAAMQAAAADLIGVESLAIEGVIP